MDTCACFSLKITHRPTWKQRALISLITQRNDHCRFVSTHIQKAKKRLTAAEIIKTDTSSSVYTLCSFFFLKPPSWFRLLSTPFVDNWNNPTDAQLCRALQPIRGWQPSTAGTANYTSASDQRSRPDHRHGDRQSDPACHQHPGNHAVTNQAWTAGNMHKHTHI